MTDGWLSSCLRIQWQCFLKVSQCIHEEMHHYSQNLFLYPQVDSVLQGEMGATVFMHPYEWIDVKSTILSNATSGSNALDPEQLFFGMALNNNKLCG